MVTLRRSLMKIAFRCNSAELTMLLQKGDRRDHEADQHEPLSGFTKTNGTSKSHANAADRWTPSLIERFLLSAKAVLMAEPEGDELRQLSLADEVPGHLKYVFAVGGPPTPLLRPRRDKVDVDEKIRQSLERQQREEDECRGDDR